MNSIDKLAWLYIENRKLLCARSKGKMSFYSPGGKREAGESDQQALMREINEELSVDLIPESMEYAGTFNAQADGKPEGVMVKMTCYYSRYNGTLQPASEIEEIAWLTSADKSKSSLVTTLIMDWLVSEDKID
jgi:ADP-ribose pyrophosphatase